VSPIAAIRRDSGECAGGDRRHVVWWLRWGNAERGQRNALRGV